MKLDLISEFKAHPRHAQSVMFSYDGRELATTGMDALVQVWSLPEFANARSFQRPRKERQRHRPISGWRYRRNRLHGPHCDSLGLEERRTTPHTHRPPQHRRGSRVFAQRRPRRHLRIRWHGRPVAERFGCAGHIQVASPTCHLAQLLPRRQFAGNRRPRKPREDMGR